MHPHNVEDLSFDDFFDALESNAQHANIIGETGLDYYYDFAPKKLQMELFEAQIDFAKAHNMGIVIHCRESAQDIYETLKRKKMFENSAPSILHCFSESTEWAKKFLDIGLMISFSGILTFKRSEDLRKTAATIPLDRLLVETDAPYLAPMPFRGKQNQPAYVSHTFDVLSSVRPESSEDLMNSLWNNSLRTFQLQ